MKNKEELINEAGQQIRIILDDLWDNECISRNDYLKFISECVMMLEDEKMYMLEKHYN